MLKIFLYQLKKPYHFIKTGILNGLLAQILTGFPNKKIKIITITGTDGKTTSSTLLYHLLKNANRKSALLTTVAAYLGEKKIETGFHVTAPLPNQTYKLLKEMVDLDYEYLVLEMTSHGAYQYRDWGLKPLIAGLTNITHEHLDYHLDFKRYLAAKVHILKKARLIILPKEDENNYFLKRSLKGKNLDYYSTKDRLSPELKQLIKQIFPEHYNQKNAYLAIKIAKQLGINNQELIVGLKNFPGVEGRMEEIKNNRGLEIFVDFAHTPNALQNSLEYLKTKLKKGKKLIAIFGCAGQRDLAKRPLMGKISAQLADLSIFTSEDPRNEDPWAIIAQMKSDLGENHHKILSIADRQEAISYGLTSLAKRGDIVAILGKGHEKSMCYGQTELPWSDQAAVKKALDS